MEHSAGGKQGAVGLSTTPTQGEIRAVGILDLTSVSAAEDFDGITAIRDVGLILVRESMAGRLGRVAMSAVGATVTVPDGNNVKIHTGVTELSGQALSAPGHEDDVLVLAGPVIITGAVEQVTYKALIINGVLVAPKESQSVLSGSISRLNGVAAYYSGSTPRVFTGSDHFSKAFFEYLDQPITMVLAGDFTFEPDVTAELLKQKVLELVVVGHLKAHRDLVPLVQVLAVAKAGKISALPDA
ncbi:MAG: hypothetical protein ACR2JY_00540 [Chloroflexota bacterium]